MKHLFKSTRRAFWLASSIFSRHKRLIIYGFLFGVILFVLSAKILPFLWERHKKDTKSIAMVGLYTPEQLPIQLQRMVSSGLTDIDETGMVVPAAATQWSISEDGKTYTLKLRTDLSWHDGKKFEAQDVNYNIKGVKFEAITDDTLKITLDEPYSPLLPNFLVKPLFRKGLIGLGSYKIASTRLKGEHVAFMRLTPQVLDLPQIEIRFYASESIAKTAFKLGEVNFLDEIIDANEFKNWKNIIIKENPKYNQYVAVFFNLKHKQLSEKEIRQGLSYAIQKPEKYRISTPISSTSWAYTNQVKQYDTDIDEAKKMLSDFPEDVTLTLSTFAAHEDLAKTIASSWETAGVKTQVRIEQGIPEEFDALLVTREILTDPDQYALWHSTQTDTNITHYNNPKIDKLLEDGRKATDTKTREKIYFDFQRYTVEDAPAIFLYHPSTYTVSRV